ncbi:MAG: flagellar basal-body rod protein FlgF [Deltaproteobacteria bacterium]|nr:flagellar basal-body rod protein FlgF [Deltaproteobacteria bacterium]
MGFGIVAALSGAKARELELEVLSNNISNIQTTGYKEMSVSFSSELNKHQPENKDLATAQASLRNGETYIDFRQGAAFQTNNPTDVALQGDGFFALQTPEGIRYTRDGNFSLDASGKLINARGDTVLSDSGPITIPSGTIINIGTDGQITADQEVVGKLQVVDFMDRQKMKPLGNNYMSADGLTATETVNIKVLQGHLENSNVNLVENLTRIIQVSRAYESIQKTIKQQINSSKMLNKLPQIG